MKDILKMILGYFSKDKKNGQGPTVLGMDTDQHRKVPHSAEFDKAVRDAEELREKEERDMKRERLD